MLPVFLLWPLWECRMKNTSVQIRDISRMCGQSSFIIFYIVCVFMCVCVCLSVCVYVCVSVCPGLGGSLFVRGRPRCFWLDLDCSMLLIAWYIIFPDKPIVLSLSSTWSLVCHIFIKSFFHVKNVIYLTPSFWRTSFVVRFSFFLLVTPFLCGRTKKTCFKILYRSDSSLRNTCPQLLV